MREFTVTWAINIDAETPEDAVLEAFSIQRDPTSTATVFEIKESHHKPVILDVDPVTLKVTRLS
jgi:hypothetical protein